MMTPMLLMIVQLVVLSAQRVVNLMLLLSWGISIVFMILRNWLFLACLWRSFSSSRRNLMVHASLINPLADFVAKCFGMFTSLSASVGYSST